MQTTLHPASFKRGMSALNSLPALGKASQTTPGRQLMAASRVSSLVSQLIKPSPTDDAGTPVPWWPSCIRLLNRTM